MELLVQDPCVARVGERCLFLRELRVCKRLRPIIACCGTVYKGELRHFYMGVRDILRLGGRMLHMGAPRLAQRRL
jgi:hypothetical protein